MYRKLSFFLAAALLLALPAGCGKPSAIQTGPPAPESAPVDTVPVLATPDPTPEPAPEAVSPEPTLEPTPESTPGPVRESTPLTWQMYEFGIPVEESEPVSDDSFFDNAVFLGDSRTEGLELYGGLKHGAYYWAQGMTVFRADGEGSKVFSIDGEDVTLLGTLSKRSYDSVYVMLGLNELGYPVASYESGLSRLVDKVLDAQPGAVVYLQLLPPLNDAICQANGMPDYINNGNLQKFNEVIRRVAAEKKVALLNTAEVYTGEDGQLPAELSRDGCHFVCGAYSLWARYLRSHIIDRERYLYSRVQA